MIRNRGALKRYLISFLLIFIVPMTVLFGYMIQTMRKNAESEQIEETRSELALIYAMVQNDLNKFEPTALLALDNPSLRPSLLGESFYNYYNAVETLKEIVRSNSLIEMAIVYDRLNNFAVSNYGTTPLQYFGKQVWSTTLDNGMTLTDYIESLEQPSYAFGDVTLSGIGVRRCVLYFCPSQITQQANNSVFIVVMPVANIPELFRAHYSELNNGFFLFDSQGEMIVSYGQTDGMPWEIALESAAESHLISYQGNEYCVAMQTDENSGWQYLNILSLTKANEALAQRVRLFSVLFLALISLGGVGLYMALRWSYFPLLRLSNQVQSLVDEPKLNEEETIRKAMETLQDRLREAEQHIIAVQPAAKGYMVQQATLGRALDDFLYANYSKFSVDSLRKKNFTVAALSISECAAPETLCERLRQRKMTVYPLNEMTQDLLLLIIETDAKQIGDLTRTMSEALRGCEYGLISVGSLSRFDKLHYSCFEAELGLMLNGSEAKRNQIIPAQSLASNAPPLLPQFCAGMVRSLHEILRRGDAARLAEFPEKWKNALDKVDLPRMEYSLLCYELFWAIVSAFSDSPNAKELFQKMLDYFYAVSPVTSKERLADAAAFFCTNAFYFLGREGNEKQERLIEILAYVDAHCAERNFSIQLVADTLHVSLSWLSRFFKDQMHITITEYVHKKRIEHIKHLLLESDLSMNEISEMVGYSSASSFIRFFKSECGITPAQFKEMNEKQP